MGRFQSTRWSVVLRARDASQASSRRAIASLCEDYWYPLYAYLRRRGVDEEGAADLIQGYFARFLEKGYIQDVTRPAGRFRAFLLASLKHYVSNERARARARKRRKARRTYRSTPGTPSDATGSSPRTASLPKWCTSSAGP
jgi:RNA polymerase sigma-70 factor (ECF subfamily)